MLSAPKAALAAFAITASTFMVAVAPAEAVTVYKNCDALNRDWKNGVAKSKRAAVRTYRNGHYMPAYGPRAQKVYWANYKGRDADRDGVACERSR